MRLVKRLFLFLLITMGITGITGCRAAWDFRPDLPAGVLQDDDFAAFRERKRNLPARQDPVTLIAVGDIMLSRGVAREMKKRGDIGHPFLRMMSTLKGGDIVFGNLEAPITPGREVTMPEMRLRADPGVEKTLSTAGFNILNLANNHTLDFGPGGLLDTLRHLDQAGVTYIGAGPAEENAYEPKIIEIKGVRLAFLGCSDPSLVPPESSLDRTNRTVIAALELEKVVAAVRKARELADFVVFSMHAGTEYAPEPDQTQTRFARLAVDAGADLVLGHHPHVVQRVERYKGKYIFYSLGNFVFDQLWSRATREGLVVKFYVNKNGVEKIEFLPIFINDMTQPQLLEGKEALSLLKNVGLELNEMNFPAFDQDNQLPKKSKKYLFYSQRPLWDYRLVKKQRFDLDQNGADEEYSLEDGKLKVTAGLETIWKSPDEWWVDTFILGDADNDGIPELNLSVWKVGSFGPRKPFWITGEDNSIKNHLFLFKLVNGSFKPVWQSSNLDRPNYEVALEDLDGDGKNELIAVEGSYVEPGFRQVTAWRWNGWGFSRISGDEQIKPGARDSFMKVNVLCLPDEMI